MNAAQQALLLTLHEAVEDAVLSNSEREDFWDEDQITRDWLKALATLATESALSRGPVNVNLAAFKLRGAAERDHGDVAVLVRVYNEKALKHLDGVAYLEAKRSSFSAPFRYAAYRKDQYDRVTKGSPQHRYLLYRREPLRVRTRPGGELSAAHEIRTCVCPSYLLSCFDHPVGDELFGLGMPLAMQIFRYCHAWDLEIPPPGTGPVAVPEGVKYVLAMSASHDVNVDLELPAVPGGYEALDQAPGRQAKFDASM